MVIRITKTQS